MLLSDITTGDGMYIDQSIYDGVDNPCLSDIYDWPNQGKPGKLDWNEWKRALELTFDVTVNNLRLSVSYQLNEWDVDIPSNVWQ